MKNISCSVLPHFHGKSTKDLDEFLFEFNILCRIHDYTSSEQKLKLFHATLKDNSLCWFMSLGSENVANWEQMKQVFLGKYQEYYRTKDKGEELFKMVQKYEESLEDFVERFLYNVQREGQTTIGKDVLNIILLQGIGEYCLDMINLIWRGDIYKESFDHIMYLCR